jgi:hypothetical protein
MIRQFDAGKRAVGLAVTQVDVWAGREKGLWAPNGCWEMDKVFTCLCRGVLEWSDDVMVEVMGRGWCVKGVLLKSDSDE